MPALAPNALRMQSRSIRVGRSTIAMTVTLAVHVVVIGTLLLDRTVLTNDLRNRAGDGPPPLMITSLLGDSEAQLPDKTADVPATFAVATNWTEQMPATDLADESGIDDASSAAPGGSPEQARYLAQIAARIERSWQSGLSPDEIPRRGRCDVWVTQFPDGTISTIEQVGCTERALNPTALVTAVQRSSPLPSAPDSAQFIADLAISVDVEHGLVAVVPRRTSEQDDP